MKDGEIISTVIEIGSTVDELRETVDKLEQNQQVFFDGLDNQISDGLNAGLDESKNALRKYIADNQKINNGIIELVNDLEKRSAEVDSKMTKAVLRVQIAALLAVLCLIAAVASFRLVINDVLDSLSAANEAVRQAADYVGQANSALNLELNPPQEVPVNQLSAIINGVNDVVMGGLVLVAVIAIVWIVVGSKR